MDSDRKAFSAVADAKPYGSTGEITKEECVCHFQKRVGTCLCELKNQLGSSKLTDGSRKLVRDSGYLLNRTLTCCRPLEWPYVPAADICGK